jgi:TonB family protein
MTYAMKMAHHFSHPPPAFAKRRSWLVLLAILLAHLPLSLAQEPPTAAPSHVILISEVVTSALILQKVPPKYPESAAKAGIEGKVVLRIRIDLSGAVQDVRTVSGDPALVDAAVEAVRQWKYKPYEGDHGPAEIESLVTISFHLQKSGPPPLGSFEEGAYSNPYFNLYYPLSKDWVRETGLVRERNASEPRASGAEILLVEVHIPQDNTELIADTSFTLFAINRSAQSYSDDCRKYLEALAHSIQINKQGKQKGDVTEFTIAERDYYRADFEFRQGPDDQVRICSVAKDYLLLWDIQAWSKKATETAVSTLNATTTFPVAPGFQASSPSPAAQARPQVVHVVTGISSGLLVKKVVPVYPRGARNNRIQGTVRIQARINKNGEVDDLEVINGPIELVVSAVNAVRRWRYKPYTLNGEPVAVMTEIEVNYSLTP